MVVTIFTFASFCCNGCYFTPPPATPPQIALRPPPRTSNDLRILFSEAEQDINTKKGNSQLVKSWIYFYRLCLKDPLSFALVK